MFYGLITLLALLAIAGLALLLARPYTPSPPRVIGWADWTTRKIEAQYQKELTVLRQDLAELARILQSRLDPVQAELAASRIV